MNVNESPVRMKLSLSHLLVFALLCVSFASLSALERVNINTATAEELARVIHGVGDKKAQAIIAHRVQNGRFNSLFELEEVHGIGQKTIRKNIERLKLQD